MKKVVILAIFLVVDILSVDKFSIIKSIDEKVCNHVVRLLNNDLKKDGKIDLNRHEEFNWVEWETYKKLDGVYDLTHFDINNDQNEEAVFLFTSFFHNREIEDLYVLDDKDTVILNNKRFSVVLEEKKIAKINNGFGLYTFNNSEKIMLLEKIRPYIVNAHLFPLQLNNQFYIVIFGNVESLSGEMPNNAKVVIVTRINEKNQKYNLCYLQRDKMKEEEK